MVSKTKNVDTILKPAEMSEIQVPTASEEPLLSILEPSLKSSSKKGKKKITDIVESPLKPSFFSRHRKSVIVATTIFVSLLVLVSLIGVGAYAHQAMYENKVFPGVAVWGENVSGKSVAEVQQIIADKGRTYSVSLKGPDQDYAASASDLGLTFNSESMALSAYSRGRTSSALENYLTRARLLATKLTWNPLQDLIRAKDLAIAPSYNVNEETFDKFVNKVVGNIQITAQDSQVTVVNGQVQLKPAIFGRDVKVEDLKKQVRDSLNNFDSKEISVETVTIKPAIIDDAAQDVMVQAQSVMKRPVSLTYGGQDYRPNQETVASWITFIKNAGDTKYTLVVDKTKMASYFDFLGTKVNIYPVARKVRVENGAKETEISPGVNGTLIDTAVLGAAIATALPNQASVNLAIPTYVAQFKTDYDRVVIADWAKYVDINLTTQTMTACERGGVNCRQWLVTTGNDAHATPTGTFLVLGRNANFYMTGGTPGVDYYKVWVDRAIWFTSAGHAIHDAAWRNGSFGGQDYHSNGSHGCINSPDAAANFIYDWAPVGTPIIIHY